MPGDHLTSLAVRASHGQERLWFVDRANPDARPSLLVAGLELRGALDAERLSHSVAEVVERHEVLRTTLVPGEDGLLQVVHALAPGSWPPAATLDVPGPGETTETRLLRLDQEAREWCPDLAEGPLLRLTLADLEADRWVLHVAIHHAVADAVTLRLFLEEVSARYRGESLPAPRLHHADVSDWLQGRVDRGDFEGDRAYWRPRLQGLSLPVWDDDDASRPGPAEVSPATGADLGVALSDLAVARRTSQQCVLVAALGLATCLDQGVSRVAVGVPVDARSRPDLRRVLGFLVNTVAVPVSHEQGDTLDSVLGRVREEYAGALAHCELPFDEVVRTLAPDRDRAAAPVFQVMVTTHTDLLAGIRFPGVELVSRPVRPPALPVPLLVTLGATDGSPMTFHHDGALGRRQAQRMADSVARLLLEPETPCPAPGRGAASTAPPVGAASARLETAPADLVARVGAVLARTLGREDCLPADAHFFRAGGHSLLAVQALDQISLELGTQVPLALIFEHPVVEDLASAIHALEDTSRSVMVRQPRVPQSGPCAAR